jgi:hypothetical protein
LETKVLSCQTEGNKFSIITGPRKLMITGDRPAICKQFAYFEENVFYQRNPEIIAEKIFFRITNPWVVEKLKINKQKAFLVRYSFSDLKLKLIDYLYEICGTYFKFNVY